ncbi:hypothetical protein B7C51_24650 (plasmid) [Paenibacillus larvae subsp. pulvifaciens]|uniref:DNA-directed DNA polymerase n=1 Tax=Paenibacillus larvae subsp. pulvifaciens TaxID=1477 RepID=A0A1V0UZR0_9BACL|nr:DNA polymerase III subunit alpha [Paenibacillus larvae]ARF70667.1 hypothetical protein B7C51_24650 [Paenibacillus larvae subsp. pulvifaciens]
MCNDVECQVSSSDGFVNLHLHTAYSLLDGMGRPEDVVSKVKSLKQRGFAVTEHGNVHSSVKLFKMAKENSLKFVYGCEFYICQNRFERDKNNKYYHLTVLAKNEKGRQNINKLVSLGYIEGFYFKPRIDFELLSQHSQGLIVMSGCMASELQQSLAGGKIGIEDINITSGNIEKAKEIARKYQKVFGSDYYLEVQAHRDPRQQQLNRVIIDIAKELSIKYVATADSHFINEEDHELHKIFIAINRKKDSYEADETYLDTQIQSEKEVWDRLISLSDEEKISAIRTTQVILDKCNSPLPLSSAIIPKVTIPKGFENQDDYLKHLCRTGWKFRNIHKKSKEKQIEYKKRLQYEYKAIKEMGFSGYYLLVEGYANSVKRRGIARGSGGGSLIAYLLNIVDIDPIEHGLYFERFIDVAQLDLLRNGKIKKEELKIPDFDLDFGTTEREQVLASIVKDHGQNKVAALCQFSYIWDKSAIKDVGRVLNIPFDITNQITKTMDDLTIQEAISKNLLNPFLKKYPKLFDYAIKLAGLPRSYGVHPCGKVISTQDIQKYTAISVKDEEYVLHIDMKDAEALGLVKVDLLGLRTISVIYDTLDMIGKDTNYIRNLNYKDENVLKVFRKGWTDGVFQFESDGMKTTMKKMQPHGLNDLSAVNALYRPGSKKYIDTYINRMHGKEKIEYLHPDLEEILGVTYGIIVFQEQLISIGRYAGLRNPDLLRQATGKKDAKKLKRVEPELRKGLKSRGWTESQIDELWQTMLDFAKYSFNKAHSQAYAMIAFICAFLKTYHPLEFICAWFNSLEAHHDKLDVAHKELKRLKIKLSKPTFRNAQPLCKVEDGAITYGISLLKHCNRQIAEELQMLAANKYEDFVNLLIDMKEKTSINSKQLDILIRLGYFSEFGNMEKLLTIYNELTNGKNRYNKQHKDKTKKKRQTVLIEFEKNLLDNFPDVNPSELAFFEKDIYGFIKTSYPNMPKSFALIMEIDLKYTPTVKCIILNSGKEKSIKIRKDKFYGREDIEAFNIGDIIEIKKTSKKNKVKFIDGEYVKQPEMQYYLEKCSIVYKNNKH